MQRLENFQPLDTFQLLESSTVGFWVSKIPNIFQPFEKIIQRLEISNVWNVENIGYYPKISPYKTIKNRNVFTKAAYMET